MNWLALKEAFLKAGKSLIKLSPMILSIVLLVSLITVLIPDTFYRLLFGINPFSDLFAGATAGSILVGNPVTSYIIGGELLDKGVSLFAVTAFIVAWVTVGIVQFPAEAAIFGKKFAFLRNLSAYFLAVIVAIITVIVLGVI